jgi:hypothetical protein
LRHLLRTAADGKTPASGIGRAVANAAGRAPDAERAEVTKIAAKVKETLLLDLVMPNGLAMRFCSGTQMAGFGAAYAKIAERVGDAMVGEVMVESEVKALLQAAV